MKHSSPALIRTEPRGHAEIKNKKQKNLTKIVAVKDAGITSFKWPVVMIDYNFFLQYNCLKKRIRIFLSVNEPMLHKLVSNCYNY